MKNCRLCTNSPLPIYMPFPKFLLDFDISESSKIVYTMLLDRAKLSQNSENFKNEKDEIYVYFTISELAKLLKKGETTIKNCLKILENNNLISRKNEGFNKASKIFLCVPQGSENGLCSSPKTDLAVDRKLTLQQSENGLYSRQKTDLAGDRKLPPNNNKYINNKYNKYNNPPCEEITRNYNLTDWENDNSFLFEI